MLEFVAICLATNIYFEARGEPLEGQIAVAHVTMMRAGNKPEKVCNKVLEKKQFSWLNGKTQKKGTVVLAAFNAPQDKKAWSKAMKIATRVVQGRMWDNTGEANHYHATTYKGKPLKPKWTTAHCMQQTVKIGNHIFYRCVNYAKRAFGKFV